MIRLESRVEKKKKKKMIWYKDMTKACKQKVGLDIQSRHKNNKSIFSTYAIDEP